LANYGERRTKIGDGEIRPALLQNNQLANAHSQKKKKIGQALLAPYESEDSTSVEPPGENFRQHR